MSSTRPSAGRKARADELSADFPEHQPRAASAKLALQGIRVVDFTHYIAGPFSTTIFADMGADVVKIESPGKGDNLRQYPPMVPAFEGGAPFMRCDRNKCSIALNLRSPEGLGAAKALIAKADVVVENSSTGVMERLALAYESCRLLTPGLTYITVSVYGREGSFSGRLGLEPIALVESRFISVNAYPAREGVRAPSPVMDISTALQSLVRPLCGPGREEGNRSRWLCSTTSF